MKNKTGNTSPSNMFAYKQDQPLRIEFTKDNYRKDDDMYIFPDCIANVKWRLLNKGGTRSPGDEEF